MIRKYFPSASPPALLVLLFPFSVIVVDDVQWWLASPAIVCCLGCLYGAMQWINFDVNTDTHVEFWRKVIRRDGKRKELIIKGTSSL